MNPEDLEQLRGVNVKFNEHVESKPVIEDYKTSWPWDIEPKLIEEDQGHSATIKVEDVNVNLRGVVVVGVGEDVTIWRERVIRKIVLKTKPFNNQNHILSLNPMFVNRANIVSQMCSQLANKSYS